MADAGLVFAAPPHRRMRDAAGRVVRLAGLREVSAPGFLRAKNKGSGWLQATELTLPAALCFPSQEMCTTAELDRARAEKLAWLSARVRPVAPLVISIVPEARPNLAQPFRAGERAT